MHLVPAVAGLWGNVAASTSRAHLVPWRYNERPHLARLARRAHSIYFNVPSSPCFRHPRPSPIYQNLMSLTPEPPRYTSCENLLFPAHLIDTRAFFSFIRISLRTRRSVARRAMHNSARLMASEHRIPSSLATATDSCQGPGTERPPEDQEGCSPTIPRGGATLLPPQTFVTPAKRGDARDGGPEQTYYLTINT